MSVESVLGFVGVVVVAIIGYLGIVTTARQNRKASRESREVTEAGLEIDRQGKLVEQLGEQVDRLWARTKVLEDAKDADRDKIENLERENADLRQHTVTCAEDVEKLRRRVDDYANRYRAAVRYVKTVHDWISESFGAEHRPPEPPEGLLFDLADPLHSEHDVPPDGWPPIRERRSTL